MWPKKRKLTIPPGYDLSFEKTDTRRVTAVLRAKSPYSAEVTYGYNYSGNYDKAAREAIKKHHGKKLTDRDFRRQREVKDKYAYD